MQDLKVLHRLLVTFTI